MRAGLAWLALVGAAATVVAQEVLVRNGAMEGPATDHSAGKGLLLAPAGWTPVNVSPERGDRLSVEPSERAGAGQCLRVHTFGSDAGVYQSLVPLQVGSTYLVSAWVKRLSGTLAVEAYPYAWGPAVMRRLDGTSTGWTQITVGLSPTDAGAHLYLVASPEAEFLIDEVQVRPAALTVGTPELLPYDFGAGWRYRVTLAPVAGATVPEAVVVQPVTELGGRRELGPPQTVRLGAKAAVEAVVQIPLECEENLTVEVRQADTGQVVGGSAIVAAPGSPWQVRYPHKEALFASLGYAWPLRVSLLTATPAVLAGLQARVVIRDAAGVAVREAAGRLEGAALVVPLAGKGLAAGDYRLGLAVRQGEGKEVYQAERPLRVLAPAPQEVVVGPDGGTRVNGKPFYPIGLYWVLADPAGWRPGPARKTADLTELRQAGFNTLHTYAFEHNDAFDTDDNAVTYLDMARDLGFMVMMGLRRDSYQGVDLNRAAIEQRVQRLREHPALLCWTLWDEPDSNLANVPRVQAVYDLVNGLDPYHPAMPVFMSGGGRPFHRAADINLFDCYPGAGNAGILPGVMARARAALPDKPIWYVAQAYQQGDKLPSEADMRQYWQHALDAEAKAILWYSYGGDARAWDSIRITPEHYANVLRAVRAMADRIGAP